MQNLQVVQGEIKTPRKEFDFDVGDCRLCGTPFAIRHKHHDMGLCCGCAKTAAISWLAASAEAKQ